MEDHRRTLTNRSRDGNRAVRTVHISVPANQIQEIVAGLNDLRPAPAPYSRWYTSNIATLSIRIWFLVITVMIVNFASRPDSPTQTSDLQRFWGQYAPYYSVEEYQLPPDGCEVTQVNILQRHGARFPTGGKSKAIKRSLKKLQSASKYKDAKLEFLPSYQWHLGESDLVPYGATQSYESGAEIYHRYGHLLNEDTLPFVRSSGGLRVVDSAVNWTAGFTDASGEPYGPTVSVIIPETKNSNNTLDNHMCPNSKGTAKRYEVKLWRDTFTAPIVNRLNRLAVGAEIDSEDVPDIMSLCPFEVVSEKKASPFCALFSVEEFQANEYHEDLKKYYKTGYGNPLGRVQGVGYVNELLARLTRSPVEDRTQTNTTHHSSQDMFPLDRTIYADFSHAGQMISIYCALGLFPQTFPPSPTTADRQRTWVTSRIIPFSGRMITEKLKCSNAEASGDFVRILVNDVVQPLAFCGGDKLCGLEAFVESQAYARSNGDGDFERCHAV